MNIPDDIKNNTDFSPITLDILEKNKLPMVTYYPINKITRYISPKIKGVKTPSQLDVYSNALETKANFQSFFECFKD